MRRSEISLSLEVSSYIGVDSILGVPITIVNCVTFFTVSHGKPFFNDYMAWLKEGELHREFVKKLRTGKCGVTILTNQEVLYCEVLWDA